MFKNYSEHDIFVLGSVKVESCINAAKLGTNYFRVKSYI